MFLLCLNQGDQGLPGEVGSPGERGIGEHGDKVCGGQISALTLFNLTIA